MEDMCVATQYIMLMVHVVYIHCRDKEVEVCIHLVSDGGLTLELVANIFSIRSDF